MVLKSRELNLDNNDWIWLVKYCADKNDGAKPSKIIRKLIKDFRKETEN